MDDTEDDLIKRAQEGSPQAFTALVHLHGRRVLRLVVALLGDQDEAQDAYQEIFLRVYDKLSTFRFESSFGVWLRRIAVNYCLDLRKRKHWPWRTVRALNRWAEHPIDVDRRLHTAAEASEQSLQRQEVRTHVAWAMRALSERERTVFVLKCQQDYKIREIADLLGCAEGTVKNYLFRAMQKMRQRLRSLEDYARLG